MMEKEELFRAATRMKRYGGSFAGAIAEAYFHADSDNTRLLIGTFMPLFERYADKNWPNEGEAK